APSSLPLLFPYTTLFRSDGIDVNIVNSGGYPGNNGLIQIQNAEYVRTQNIHVRNSHRAGINIQDSKYVDVINCISENSLFPGIRSEEHTSELQSREKLVC